MTECLAGNPFGIECACVEGSLASLITTRLVRDCHLALAPTSDVVHRWVDECREVFATEQTEFPIVRVPLIEPAYLDRQTLNNIQLRGGYMPRLTTADFIPPLVQIKPLECGSKTLTHIRGIAHTDDSLIRDGVCVYARDAPSKRERLLLIAEHSFLSMKTIDRVFARNIQLTLDPFRPANITVRRCLQPATIAFDECHRVKGAKTQLIGLLASLTQDSVAPRRRKLLLLLSGTVMNCGPKDIEGILPIIWRPKKEGKVESTLAELKTQYNRAMKAIQPDTPSQSKDGSNSEAIPEFATKLDETLSGVYFRRRFGDKFLDSTIADPRTQLVYTRKFYPPVSPRHQQAIKALQASFLRDIKRHSNTNPNDRAEIRNGQIRMATVTKLNTFFPLLQCSVLPSNAVLNSIQDFPKKSDDVVADLALGERGLIHMHIGEATCAQLLALKKIVAKLASLDPPEHCLVLSLSPVTAAIAFKWMSTKCHNIARASLYHSGLKKVERYKLLNTVAQDARHLRGKSSVLFSTFRMCSEGIDTLTYANHLISLGEPYTPGDHQQAVGRLHRRGQTKTVYVYGIHGALHSLDWSMVMKNSLRAEVLSVPNPTTDE